MNHEKIWQEGIKDWDGNTPKRMTDDESEEAFWDSFLKKKSSTHAVDSYSIPFYQELSTYFTSEDKVLEIGN